MATSPDPISALSHRVGARGCVGRRKGPVGTEEGQVGLGKGNREPAVWDEKGGQCQGWGCVGRGRDVGSRGRGQGWGMDTVGRGMRRGARASAWVGR